MKYSKKITKRLVKILDHTPTHVILKQFESKNLGDFIASLRKYAVKHSIVLEVDENNNACLVVVERNEKAVKEMEKRYKIRTKNLKVKKGSAR